MNKTKAIILAALWLLIGGLQAQTNKVRNSSLAESSVFYRDSRPWTRWWWFAAEIKEKDLLDNLIWIQQHGFGGVEIAWVYPLNRMKRDTLHYTPRQAWLSSEWSQQVQTAKHFTDSLGLGCDFTFGTLWPFGDSQVSFADASMNLDRPQQRQEITASWEYPVKGFVIDHLNREAFSRYAARVGMALSPALKGNTSGLFCDSWEVETRYLGTEGFYQKFLDLYHYDLQHFTDSLYSPNPPYCHVRYDYMKLISQLVLKEFYEPFTLQCHELGAYSRAQCSGAPVDILEAYAGIDIPESEAMLFEPSYSNIVASAAALSGKKVVSSESFTCLYGWPSDYLGKEQTADLKMLADALFANGVNHIIWHGKPMNPAGVDSVRFYASVHVGSSGSLSPDLIAFNKYLEEISGALKQGTTQSNIAVYLPVEDAWIEGELPLEKQFKWAWGAYEFRYCYLPGELKQHRPLWINSSFLEKATFSEGKLKIGDLSFAGLYIDALYLEGSTLRSILRFAQLGLPVCMRQVPSSPGYATAGHEYQKLLDQIRLLPNVSDGPGVFTSIPGIVEHCGNIDFWVKSDETQTHIFFANPCSSGLKFPLEYGQAGGCTGYTREVVFHLYGQSIPYALKFEPYQSLLITIDSKGKVTNRGISYKPPLPKHMPRQQTGREPWKVLK